MVSPARISRTLPPRAWVRPTPSVTWRVWPTACECQPFRAPGANRTTLTRTRDGASPRTMTSSQASPVNRSAGAFSVARPSMIFMLSPRWLLAAGQPLEGLGVAGALDGDTPGRRFDLPEVVRRQVERRSAHVLVEALDAAGPRDRDDPRPLGKEPRERDLRGS